MTELDTERNDSGDELISDLENETTDPEIPEKYQDKSLADVVRMHQEAESMIGRQSAEVGELRKAVDQVIKTQLDTAPKETVEEVDFFSDPERAIANAIETHPKVLEAEKVSTDFRRSTALAQLQQKHPEMNAILQDSKFGDFVKGSAIRTELFQRADSQYDYAAADELFSQFKQTQKVAEVSAHNEQTARKQSVKAGQTGGRGSGGGSRKMLRRADIINLQKTDPAKFAAMADEIDQAYAEGRVK